MIVELTNLKVDPRNAEDFERAWREAEPTLMRQPGYIKHRLGRYVEAPSAYVLEVEWDTLEAHTQHFANSPDFQPFLATFVSKLSGEADVTHFRVVSCSSGRHDS